MERASRSDHKLFLLHRGEHLDSDWKEHRPEIGKHLEEAIIRSERSASRNGYVEIAE